MIAEALAYQSCWRAFQGSMNGLPGILLAALVSGLLGLRYVAATDSYDNGGSCYDCQYAPYGLATTERGTWHLNTYSGFHRCALEQEDDAFYVNKWSCTSERCFIRKDPNGQVFRGCADPWNLPWGINTSSNCSKQGQSDSIWWFCDGHLCNDGFLHDSTRCGPSASEPPKQDRETLLSYHNAPYYTPQHQGALEQESQPENYPGTYEDDSSFPTTVMTPSVETERMPSQYSIGTGSLNGNEASPNEPLEYVLDEETVHGVGFYNNFGDLEETKPLKPQRVHQDEPQKGHQVSSIDSSLGHTIDNTLESHSNRGIYPGKHAGIIYDYEDPAQEAQSSTYDNAGRQPPRPLYAYGSIPLNRQSRIYGHVEIQPQNKKSPNYGYRWSSSVQHQPRRHQGNRNVQPPEQPRINSQEARHPPVDSQPTIYDHGGRYPTNVQPEIIDNGGIPPRPALKKNVSGQASLPSTEPFWMWWWHSGAFQRMTPQQAYNSYLDKNAVAIKQSNKVSIGGVSSSKGLIHRNRNNEGTHKRTSRLRYPPRYPYHLQYDYSPIQSNLYYSRSSRRSTESDYHLRKDANKRYGNRPIRTVKTINPLDYKSFKPPHTHSIEEPLGPVPKASESELNSNIKQNETTEEDRHAKKAEKVLTKQAFYDYYDNLKLNEKKERVRGHVTSSDDYNPCTMTCYDTPGTLHKDPLRHDRFIQCGPGSRHGEACKCCQPFYHICPEGTSFAVSQNVCSQGGSNTIEKTKYKTLDFEY